MHRNYGFSLVELAVVLVIIGLIGGGVIGGQSLIRAAALRSVPVQAQNYIGAAQLFIQEYGGLPGDLRNAQSYWGIADADAATCATTASVGDETCNGDGNGALDVSTGSVEYFRFWQHLGSAGMVEGKFTGITDGSNDYSATRTNSPTGKINNSLWATGNLGVSAGDATHRYAGTYDNYLLFGYQQSNQLPLTGVMLPEEMYNIDQKIDDGVPATGALWAYRYTDCTNASSQTDYAATYDFTVRTNACVLVWPQAFRVN